ncbi:MAG TPA: transglutaminase family protein, partial [Rubrivivax sp.]|nr:transglutaminase family protein [Rubrivivax sp.]
EDGRAWRVFTHGIELPLRREHDALGEVAVFGLRYRSFVPMRGLHPMLGAQVPVQLLLHHPSLLTDHCVSLHEWQPAGEAYDGLPQDLAEASRRRAERLTVVNVARELRPTAPPQPTQGLSPYALDLRCLR